ncbi:MAG: hypothetical protein GXZ14_00865 [Ruminococcaceae bacterium]|nr:hypothetical protein [Oscillospiraceae bacterium]
MFKLYNGKKLFPTDTGAASAPTDGAENTDTEETDEGAEEEAERKPENKPVTMTQAEIDRMINRAFKKGARSVERTAQTDKAPAATADKPNAADGEAEKKAAEMLEKANKTLLKGTVRGLAAELHLTDKGAQAAVKLADFKGCFGTDGELDEEEVKDVLKDFASDYPEFVQTEQQNDDQTARRVTVPAGKTKTPAMDALRAAFGLK